MKYKLERIVKPAVEPITLAEAKLFLRVDGSSEDSLITTLISVTREYAEEYLHRSLVTQTWCMTFADSMPDEIFIPRPPVISVDSIKVTDDEGVETLLDPSSYKLNGRKDILIIKDGSVFGERIEFEYTAGYGDATDVPASIRQGMLMHMASMFDDRTEGLPSTAKSLYQAFRIIKI